MVEIQLANTYRQTDPELEQALQHSFAQIELVQGLMSFHDPDSDLSRINRAPVGAEIRINPHTLTVLRMAEQLRQDSGGLFDIGWGGHLVASGYLPSPVAGGTDTGMRPGTATCVAAHTDAPDRPPCAPVLTFGANDSVQKHQARLLDLGGIAKGYAVDLALSSLQQSGVKGALVNAGGDMRGFGEQPWPVALRHPRHPASMGWQVALSDAALASSARYFDQRHLLHGQTGQAVEADYSVTVQAPSCMLADALCKIVYASANPHHPCLAQYHASAALLAA
jgi:thiamine biosynthesis lipoprotein